MNLERWNDLKQRYADMEDMELQRLRATFDDLSPEGQDVLRREFDARQLSWELPVNEAPTEPALDPRFYTKDERQRLIAAGGVALETPSDQLGFATWLLDQNGIEYGVAHRNQYDADIAVAPSDVARAQQILSSATDDERKEYAEIADTEPEPLACPACASDDIMVQDVDDEGNSSWICNACGKEWEDEDLVPDQEA